MHQWKSVAVIVITIGLAFWALVEAQALAPQPAVQSCDEQLQVVLKHDQELQTQRNQLEVRVASLQATLDAKDREIGKLKSDLAAATKPKESPKPAAADAKK